jgi:hypothetical protein
MGRKTTTEKNRVYIECSETHKKVKAWIIRRDERTIKVELPTGFVMELTKRHKKGIYTFQAGLLEFLSDGKPIA